MSVVLVPSLSDDQVLAWSAEDGHLPLLPDSPFHQLVGLSRPEMKASQGQMGLAYPRTLHLGDDFKAHLQTAFSTLGLVAESPFDEELTASGWMAAEGFEKIALEEMARIVDHKTLPERCGRPSRGAQRRAERRAVGKWGDGQVGSQAITRGARPRRRPAPLLLRAESPPASAPLPG